MRTTDISQKLKGMTNSVINTSKKAIAPLAVALAMYANPAQGELVTYNPDQVGTVGAPVYGISQNSSDFQLTTANSWATLDQSFTGNNQETPQYGNPSSAKDGASLNDSNMLQLGTDNNLRQINSSNGSQTLINGHGSINLGANVFGIGYDSNNANKVGFGSFDGSTMSFHTYDFGTDQIENLGSLSFDSALYGTPSGLDFANVNGDLRMIVGTKDQQTDIFSEKKNFILDIGAIDGIIDQYATLGGDNEKVEDLSYDSLNNRLAVGYSTGLGDGQVINGDFVAVPEPVTMGLVVGGGLGLLALRRLFTPEYKR